MLLRPALLAAFLLALAPAFAVAAGNEQNGAQSPSATPTPGSSATPTASSPFATPSPTPTPGPIGNGFAVIGFSAANASGGVIPSPSGTATPAPFPGSGANGFFADVAGRLSNVYVATLRFTNYGVRGGDNPVVTRSDGALYYTPKGGTLAFGVGFTSLQRSTGNTSTNAPGIGASLLPDLRQTLSPYVNLFFYPSAKTLGVTSTISTAQAGIMFKHPHAGVLVKLGFDYQSYPNNNFSPTSIGGVQLGIGASF